MPSRSSPNVMIFSDAASAQQQGHFDGWREDGCFHYTGSQRGDQQMKAGNAAILRHEAAGRALRLFEGSRGSVKYTGEFALDAELPSYTTDAPESRTGNARSVIVFRMRPLDARATQATGAGDAAKTATVTKADSTGTGKKGRPRRRVREATTGIEPV